MAVKKIIPVGDVELEGPSALTPKPVSLSESTEIDEVYTTWRNRSNEQVMFPLDMADLPVVIGQDRQLFVDNYIIADTQNVIREVHQPRRYDGNPVLAPPGPKPDTVGEMCLLHFDTAPHFRMWYTSYVGHHPWKNGQEIRQAVSYAVSDDGRHWQKPVLDLYQIEGSRERNFVIPYGIIQGLFYDSWESDPQKRFKAILSVERKEQGERVVDTYYVHTSPDGIHWNGDFSYPTLQKLRGYTLPQGGIGDTSLFWYDPMRRKYVGDIKFVLPGKQRCRGVIESDDLVHWSRPTPTMFERADDAQVYGHCSCVYQGMYLGFRWIFLPDYSRRHSSYVELDCSRDGHVWTRVGAGQPFMAFNPNHDTWDATIMRPQAVLEVGDEVWIYYMGAPTEIELNNPDLPSAVCIEDVGFSCGLATVKRDRFASINAGEQVGTVITRPLDFKNGALHLNAQIAKGGEINVAVLTRDAQPIAPWTIESCSALHGDSIDMPVSWRDESKLTELNDSSVRLQFDLRSAKLFSFWID